MSTVFQPFGMKPAYHPSGLDRSVPFAGTNSYVTGVSYTAPYSLSSGQSFYQYQPVGITSSGQSIGNGGAGFSTTALASAPVATGAQGQVKVVGLGREVAFPTGETNAWADAKTIVQVQIANSQLVAPSISVTYA